MRVRRTPFLGLNADSDFERQIFVKSNIAEVLDRELWASHGWSGESIAIGTATDAYQPAEKRFRLTRGCLETLLKHRNPFSVVTKSSLIVRDLELIRAINEVAEVRIYFTGHDHSTNRCRTASSPAHSHRAFVWKH